jgi:hypothetical protein
MHHKRKIEGCVICTLIGSEMCLKDLRFVVFLDGQNAETILPSYIHVIEEVDNLCLFMIQPKRPFNSGGDVIGLAINFNFYRNETNKH